MTIRLLICGLALALVSAAAPNRSLVLTTGETHTFEPPNSAPFTALQDLRIELRLHGFAGCEGTNAQILYGDTFFLGCATGSTTLKFQDTVGAAACNMDYQSFGAFPDDVTIRLQRTMSTGRLWGRIYVTQTNATVATCIQPAGSTTPWNIGGSPWTKFGSSGTAANIAWFRMYSTTLSETALGPANVGTGDILNWTFDDTGTDSVASVALVGSLSYMDTPIYSPIAQTRVYQGADENDLNVTRAENCFTLDGASSTTFTTTLTYAWSQLAGPNTLTITNGTTSIATACGSIAGDYTIRLAVNDGVNATVNKDFHVGAVKTDANGVVLHDDPVDNYFFGPIIRYGKNRDKFNDDLQLALMTQWETYLAQGYPTGSGAEDHRYEAMWNTDLSPLPSAINTTAGAAPTVVTTGGPGLAPIYCHIPTRVTTSAASAVVTAVDNYDIRAEYCSGGTPAAGKQLALYSSDGTTYTLHTVSSCDSASQLTMTAPVGETATNRTAAVYAAHSGTDPTLVLKPSLYSKVVFWPDGEADPTTKFGIDVQYCTTPRTVVLSADDRITTTTWPRITSWWGLSVIFFDGTGNNTSYYDSMLAAGNMKARTGLDRFTAIETAIADLWGNYPNFGSWNTPRTMSLNGLMHSWYHRGILASRYTQITNQIDRWFVTGSSYDLTNTGQAMGNIREDHYMLKYIASAAVVLKDIDTAKSNSYKAIILGTKTRWDNAMATPADGHGKYVHVKADNFTIQNNIFWMDSTLQFTNGSRFATVVPEAGTISVSNGSTTVTGIGTSFKSRYCAGTTGNTVPYRVYSGSWWGDFTGWMAIVIHEADGTKTYAPVASCESDTSLTLSIAWWRSSVSGRPHSLMNSLFQQTESGRYSGSNKITLTNGSATAVVPENEGQNRFCGGFTAPLFVSQLAVFLDDPNDGGKNQLFGGVDITGCPDTTHVTLATAWMGTTGTYAYMQPNTMMWAVEDGPDSVGYQTIFLDAATVWLDKPYEGPTQTSKHDQGGGYYLQPFMLGLSANAQLSAYRATCILGACDSYFRNNAIDFGKWIAYHAYDPFWRGAWYKRNGAGCVDGSNTGSKYYLDCAGGAVGPGAPGILGGYEIIRYTTPELLVALSEAYMATGDPVILAAGDDMFDGCYAKPGVDNARTDGTYCYEMEYGWKEKDTGFNYGIGNSTSWPAARTLAGAGGGGRNRGRGNGRVHTTNKVR